MGRKFWLLLLLYSFHFVHPSHSQDFQESDQPKLKLHGIVDIYFGYDFNKPTNKNRQYTTQAARHNEFNLNWGVLHLEYSGHRVRGNMAMHTGTYAIFNYADEPVPMLRFIAEANVGVSLFENVWLDVGVLPSHIGYESTFSGDNEIYTRALMAENSPYFSTGAQLSAQITPKLRAAFVVLNGWQNITETNDAKSLGVNINYQPDDRLELNYSNYYGNEGNEATGRKVRFYNHFYARYQFFNRFHMAVAYDIGNQELFHSNEKRSWHTGLLVGEYAFTEQFSVAGRWEFFRDTYQIMVFTGTPNGFQTNSTTLNLNFKPADYTLLRLEGRAYQSKDPVFYEGVKPQRNNFLLVSSLAIKF